MIADYVPYTREGEGSAGSDPTEVGKMNRAIEWKRLTEDE